MKKTLLTFYGDNPKNSKDFGRIINQKHYQRIMKLMHSGAEIFVGGESDAEQCYIAPTILRNVSMDAPIMAEEIFGPILPVIKIKHIDEAIHYINKHPKPLALYLFSHNKAVQEKVLNKTSSGGACINHTTLQYIVKKLPFGGVGTSGMGSYHGKYSFETFSHKKSVLKKPFRFDIPIIYPPYTKNKSKWLRWLL